MDCNKVSIDPILEREFTDELSQIDKLSLKNIDVDPDKVEHGLARLVLALIELIRELMEKQAIRRIEGGSLKENEIERIGEALMKLEKKMQEMKNLFGLKDEDLKLNINLLGIGN
ncbi:MAG: gas vesicle protein K [Candidatus Firestonebacteria bacterium]|nr:gas vesicle protein K [Candidatus Firestonebacteria bacterium]